MLRALGAIFHRQITERCLLLSLMRIRRFFAFRKEPDSQLSNVLVFMEMEKIWKKSGKTEFGSELWLEDKQTRF